MLGVFAEFETNLWRERQLKGIAAAKARGAYPGRKPLVDSAEVQRLHVEEKLGATEIARRLGRSSSVYRALTRQGGWRKAIPVDSLLQLRQRLDRLTSKRPERAAQIAAAVGLYCVPATTVHWALQAVQKPHAAHRADHGKPRLLPQAVFDGIAS